MTWNEVFRNTFKELRERISPEVRKQVDLMLPSWPMVDACRADSLDAFQPFIAAGKLSVEDMHQACDRYHLGKTKTGTPIYWMIDDMNTPLDAHIGDRWISTLLKQREPLIANWHVQHCLLRHRPLCPIPRDHLASLRHDLPSGSRPLRPPRRPHRHHLSPHRSDPLDLSLLPRPSHSHPSAI